MSCTKTCPTTCPTGKGPCCGFMGKWIGFEVHNHDAFVQKVLARGPVECPNLAQAVRYAKPCDYWQEFEDCGEGKIRMTISRPNHTETICTKVGEELEVTRMDGKKVKVCIKKESDTKLVFSAAPGSTDTFNMTSELSPCGEVKCVTTELDGVKKVCKYKRVHGCPTTCGAASCCKTSCESGSCPTTGSCGTTGSCTTKSC